MSSRKNRGEKQFYNPPPMRKLQQEREKKRLEAEEQERKAKEILDRQKETNQPEECSTSDSSVPDRVTVTEISSNLGQFLECTTPIVKTQHLPLTSRPEYSPYFVLNDLWDSFEEWSVYGVGVPLLLNGIDSVIQYYVPYLSGIQLYGEDPSNESDVSSDPVFQYIESAKPFEREPLSDKILNLSSKFPALRTYRSCDLSPSSWVSVAWYPIYRIPLGQSLQNLDACFLTFHSLSTTSLGTSNEISSKSVSPSKLLPLPTFGLACYKFKLSVWSTDSDVDEKERAETLQRAAEEWLRRFKVMLPDFIHFVTRNGSAWR